MKTLFAIALFAASASGCKQGLGERCQVNADCASGECSMADPRVCVATGDNQHEMFDAEVPPPEPMAPPPVDAAVDAASD